MIYQTTFFLGLGFIVGSFLNVVIVRLKEGETIFGRSFCRSCRVQIRWYDNIPLLSFLLLQGRCRDCSEKISWQYPVVELLTGVLFAGASRLYYAPDRPETWLEFGWILAIIASFIVIAFYDMRHMEIPLITLLVAAGLTGAFLLADFFFYHDGGFFISRLWMSLLGGVAVGGFFFVLVWISGESWMGWGDVWLGAIAGLMVGAASVLPMLTFSFGFGALYGLLSIVRKEKSMKSQVPFAPFLVFGTIAMLFLPLLFPNVSWFNLFA